MKKANEFYANKHEDYDLTSVTDVFKLAEDYAKYYAKHYCLNKLKEFTNLILKK